MIILDTSPATTTAPEQLHHENGHFFEGAEKRLVVYYATSTNTADTTSSFVLPDLRTVPQREWEEVLELANCKILHSMSNSEMIAYLLSESSMFVSRNSVLLKTCGTTTLLLALPKLLQLAPKLGLQVVDVYYSHKSLLIPQAQSAPHLSFDQECDFLNNKLLSKGVKTAFSAGNMSLDRFFLYSHNSDTFERSPNFSKNEHLKFEMIMENLNESVMEQFIFTGKPHVTAKEVTINSGISRLIPEMQIDDYIFDGCGYSMNGLSGTNYLTIHITPEKGFSFVSLETNIPMKDYGAFVRKVLKCFKPGKLQINLMLAESEQFKKSKSIFELFSRVELRGFNRLELTMTLVKTLNVIYARYSSTK